MLLRNKLLFWCLSLALLALSACSKKSQVSSSRSEYQDDLSDARPRFDYIEPSIVAKPDPKTSSANNASKTGNDKPLYVNKKLESVLDTMSKQNKAVRYISGYRIQIYVGNVRQEADAAKSFVYQSFPDLTPYVSYSQPTYRVKVGDFIYRSDAEQYLERVKEQYYSAVILADRVEIKKSLLLNPVSE